MEILNNNQGSQGSQSLQDLQDSQSLRDLQNQSNNQDSQSLRNLQGSQSLQDLQDSQSLRNLQKQSNNQTALNSLSGRRLLSRASGGGVARRLVEDPESLRRSLQAIIPARSSCSGDVAVSGPAAEGSLAEVTRRGLMQPAVPMSSSQLASYAISAAWTFRNRTFKDVMERYSPARWGWAASNPEAVYTWSCPALAALPAIYGFAQAAVVWMDAQVSHLFSISSQRDVSQAERQVEAFARSFAAAAGRYSLLELMLFFARYEAGVYGTRGLAQSTAFDARAVGQAFHREFLPERKREVAVYLDRQRERELARERELRSAHAVTREHWLALAPEAPIHLSVRVGERIPLSWLNRVAELLHADVEEVAACASEKRLLEVVVRKCEIEGVVRMAGFRAVEVVDSYDEPQG